jgi:RNA polymerase sigma factor (sigma-70 family)
MRTRIHEGDPQAFGDLFDQHVRGVYNHAYRLIGDWSTAEDVVSLTFLEAWRLRRTVDVGDDDRSLRPWLLGIATNVARNVRRAARRHAHALARLPNEDVVADFADEVADRISDADRVARTRTALALLRQSEREVLALCVSAGLQYAEAAEALGVPVGTVRSRLFRARKRLAKLVAAGDLKPPHDDREPLPGQGQLTDERENAVLLPQEEAR